LFSFPLLLAFLWFLESNTPTHRGEEATHDGKHAGVNRAHFINKHYYTYHTGDRLSPEMGWSPEKVLHSISISFLIGTYG